MRVPPETAVRTRPRRRTVFLAALFGALVIVIIAVQGLSGFFTNYLWFHWNGVGEVWSTVTTLQAGFPVVASRATSRPSRVAT